MTGGELSDIDVEEDIANDFNLSEMLFKGDIPTLDRDGER